MDNLTHSLIGAALGQAGLKRKTGLAMPALIIGANIPDVDAACLLWLEGTEHLGFRRGITHGPPAMLLLPLLLAGALWWFDRWQTGRGTRPTGRLPVDFKWLYLLSLIGCLSHPLFDWFNVYGIRLLEPFSSQWFYGDVLFIIDVWLWALLGFGVWFSLRRERHGGEWMRPAQVTIAAMAAYIGVNALISAEAAASYPRNQHFPHRSIASPVPISFWEREVIGYVQGDFFVWDVGIRRWTIATGLSSDEQPVGRQDYLFAMSCVSYGDLNSNNQLRAFMFWTRVPVLDQAADGSLILRDARFYDPRARDRFSVTLPQARCKPVKS